MLDDKFKIFRDLAFLRSRKGLSMHTQHLGMLLSSIGNEQVEVFRTVGEEPIAYFAWMSLTSESLHYVKNYSVFPPSEYEWCEGRLVMIYDVVVAPGWHKVALDSMAKKLDENRFVSYFKRGRLRVLNKNLVKRYCRNKTIY